jgi:hypothetical protein
MKQGFLFKKHHGKSEKRLRFITYATLLGVLMALTPFLLGACSHEDKGTKDSGTKSEAVTEAIVVTEISLNCFKPDNEDGICVAGYNENGHGVVYSIYMFAPEDHRAEKYHYYMERYETDLLTEAFWNSVPVAVHSGQKGEINGMDWYGLWIRFYGLHNDDPLHSEGQWNPAESIGFWHTSWEQPVLVTLSECATDYQDVRKQYKDHGIFSLIQTEYGILGTKEQLIDNVPPSKK